VSFGILSLNSTTAAIQVPGIQGSSVQPNFTLASSSTANSFNPFSNPNGPFANLNLSSSQENQIDSIFSTAKSQGLSQTQVQGQVNAVLSPAQQQTLAGDVQTLKSEHQHHHHHGGGGGESSSQGSGGLLSQLDLSGDQQNQITSLLQSAQSNGTTPSDLLSSITNVLSNSQQQTLTDFFEPSTYSSTGSTPSTTNTQPYLLNTSA
jgi:Spy/CpxP family protein refolding chaperone